MDKASFSIIVSKLYSYFRYTKLPTPEQIGLWFDDVSFIPSEAGEWIFDNMKRDDGLPRNFPKAFIAQWYDFRRANPRKTISEIEYCEDCAGMGIHLFRSGVDGCTYVCRCSECRNWYKQFGSLADTGGIGPTDRGAGAYVDIVAKASRQQLVDNGHEYLSMEQGKGETHIPARLPEHAQGLANEIFEKVPPLIKPKT